jgi:DNA-binding IclR family transcriptional regulator
VISVHRWGGQSDRADRLMDIFVHHFAHTGATKAELSNVANDAGMPNTTFLRALSDLLESGALINTDTDKRPFCILGSK